MLASKSAKPLSKIELIIKVSCRGKLPIIVSMPTGDIIDTLSPTPRSKLKLNSLPIDIEFFVNWFDLPIKFPFLTTSSFRKFSLLYPLKIKPLV